MTSFLNRSLQDAVWAQLEQWVLSWAKAHDIGAHFGVAISRPRAKGVQMTEITIENTEEVDLTLTPIDKYQQPISVDGPVEWTQESGDATFTTSADGMMITFISGTSGDSIFQAKADGDIGDGVQLLSETFVLHVVSPTAHNLGAKIGTPRRKGTPS